MTCRLIALTVFLAASRFLLAAPVPFFSGPEAPANLPANEIYPQGRRMHLGAYSPTEHASKVVPWLTGIERLAQAGFTVAGPTYENQLETQFARCRAAAALGLRFSVQCPDHPALRGPAVAGDEISKDNNPLNNRPARMAAIPEESLRQHVRDWMDPFLKDPAIDAAVSSWAVRPEELRPWKAEEMAYLKIYSDEIKRHDPRHRPVFMYEPNHRSAQDLAATRAHCDVLLMGLYTSTYGWTGRRAIRVNWAMDQILAECQAGKRIPIAGLELSQDLPGFSDAELQANPAAADQLATLIQHDAWLALIRGAKGIQVWSWHENRPKYTTNLLQVNAYAAVMQALTGPADLQTPFLFGERRQDLTLIVGHGQNPVLQATDGKTANDQWIKTGSWPAIQMANLAMQGYRIVAISNSSLTPQTAILSGFPETGWHFQALAQAGGATATAQAKTLTVVLPPFGVWVGRIDATKP